MQMRGEDPYAKVDNGEPHNSFTSSSESSWEDESVSKELPQVSKKKQMAAIRAQRRGSIVLAGPEAREHAKKLRALQEERERRSKSVLATNSDVISVPQKPGLYRSEKKHSGDLQPVFKSQGRAAADRAKKPQVLGNPDFKSYNPNKEAVLKHYFKNGVTIPSERKDTTQGMIKISPFIGGLHPKYVDQKYRKLPGYLSRLDRLDKIERNFNID